MSLQNYLNGENLFNIDYCNIVNEDFCNQVKQLEKESNFETSILPKLKELLFKIYSINPCNNFVSFNHIFQYQTTTKYSNIPLLGTYLSILLSEKHFNHKYFLNDSIVHIYLQNIHIDFPELQNFQRLELVMAILSLDFAFIQHYKSINLKPHLETFWHELQEKDFLTILKVSPAKRIVFLDYLFQVMGEKIPENLIHETFKIKPNVEIDNNYYCKHPPFYFNFTYFKQFKNKDKSLDFLNCHKNFIFNEFDNIHDTDDIAHVKKLILKNYSYILLATNQENCENYKFSFIYLCSLLKIYTYLMAEIKFSMINNIKPLKDMFLFEIEQYFSEIQYILKFFKINILENMLLIIENKILVEDIYNEENIPYHLLKVCFEVDTHKKEMLLLINNAIYENEIPINKY